MSDIRPLTAASPVVALYVSAARPDRFAKAAGAGADVVIIDLEDSVPADRKEAARAATIAYLSQAAPGSAVAVRVNAPGTSWHDDDVAAMRDGAGGGAGGGVVGGIRVPKVECPDDIARVAEKAGGLAIHALIETALGVENLSAIARADGVASIGLGEADLRAELAITASDGLDWVRARLVVAARAAKLPPPMMSAWTAVKDADGLARSCREGRARGFVGRTAIHPTQIPVIRSAFAPTPAEVDHARDVLAALAAAGARGDGAALLPDGTMVDEAMRAAAERTIGLATS